MYIQIYVYKHINICIINMNLSNSSLLRKIQKAYRYGAKNYLQKAM